MTEQQWCGLMDLQNGVLRGRGERFTPQNSVEPIFPNWIHHLPLPPLPSLPPPPPADSFHFCSLNVSSSPVVLISRGGSTVSTKNQNPPPTPIPQTMVQTCVATGVLSWGCAFLYLFFGTPGGLPDHFTLDSDLNIEHGVWNRKTLNKDLAENLSLPKDILCPWIDHLPYFKESSKHDNVFTSSFKTEWYVLLPQDTILSEYKLLIDILCYCNTNVRCLSMETLGCF